MVGFDLSVLRASYSNGDQTPYQAKGERGPILEADGLISAQRSALQEMPSKASSSSRAREDASESSETMSAYDIAAGMLDGFRIDQSTAPNALVLASGGRFEL